MLESCISNISGFFNKERKDFGLIVPEYQRDYAWEEEELQRFLIDIEAALKPSFTAIQQLLEPCFM